MTPMFLFISAAQIVALDILTWKLPVNNDDLLLRLQQEGLYQHMGIFLLLFLDKSVDVIDSDAELQ